MNWFIENKEAIIGIVFGLVAIAEVVVRLTPSEKDNSILKKITDFLFILFPNRKIGGGKH